MFLITECHSKIMSQGFKMRSQPIFIWPRYECGEENSRSVKCWRRLRAHRESSFHLHRRPVSTRKLDVQCLRRRWRERRVIPLTTKNHMHIHFCASDYKRAAGHWRALIIAPIEFLWMTIFKRQERSLPAELIVTQSLPRPALCEQNHRGNKDVNVQNPNVSVLARILTMGQKRRWCMGEI